MNNPVSEHLLMQWKWMLQWMDWVFQELSDEDFKEAVFDGGNTGIWILGHLIVSDDDLSLYFGKGTYLYPEYIDLFKSGTKPKPASEYPSIPELKEAWKRVCDKNEALYKEMNDEELNEPHALFKDGENNFVKTKGETASVWQLHQLYHAGQLGVLASRIKKQKP